MTGQPGRAPLATVQRLVAIDMQNVFADPASPWATPGYGDATAGLERLLPAFGPRTDGTGAIFTRFVAPAEPTGAWIPYYEEWAFALVPDADPLYDLTPPFVGIATTIETRPTFGKWDAAFAAMFGAGGADTMLLAGVSTDCCVLSTALAAADAGIRVRVVADACAGLSPADHERALAAMALYAPLIEITSVDEVLAAA